MDKITHQVRAEHLTKIMNGCINSKMSKTAWRRANGISEKQFFYWQRILRRKGERKIIHQSLVEYDIQTAEYLLLRKIFLAERLKK